MLLQVTGIAETFVAWWTFLWLLSRVESHLTVQSSTLTKCFVIHETFVQFLSAVNSALDIVNHLLRTKHSNLTFLSWFGSSAVLPCTRRLCRCKSLDWLKLLWHTEHLYGFSSMWTLVWVLRVPDWLNALLHTRHLYGFSPVCTLMCCFRWWQWLNTLSHTLHLNGFSPLWILLCLTRLDVDANCLLQTAQSNLTFSSCFSSSLVSLCIWPLCRCKWWERLKLLLHIEHLYGFSPVCTLMCCFRLWDRLNAFSHM